jgi:large subunit ribosomal protein L6
MSRIGKLPIAVPSGVTITVDPSMITVAGSKGTLTQFTMPGIDVKPEGDQVVVTRIDDEPVHRSKHGLMRTLVHNMITGVSQGFSKQLELNGVGYRVALSGN